VGGGPAPVPGEVTLAHRGILFLDEILEFPAHVLESLRQPLEDGFVTITRLRASVTFPAEFILIGACNPCPCGNFQDPVEACRCSQYQIEVYRKRLSGPLLDRIDLRLNVPRLPYDEFMATTENPARREASAVVRDRLEPARHVQYQRLGPGQTNGRMVIAEVRRHCPLGKSQNYLLKRAADKYYLSGRSIHRILKVARTIADLGQSPEIATEHLAEALQYRL
jgi:magnesium chelatase family protein